MLRFLYLFKIAVILKALSLWEEGGQTLTAVFFKIRKVVYQEQRNRWREEERVREERKRRDTEVEGWTGRVPVC